MLMEAHSLTNTLGIFTLERRNVQNGTRHKHFGLSSLYLGLAVL